MPSTSSRRRSSSWTRRTAESSTTSGPSSGAGRRRRGHGGGPGSGTRFGGRTSSRRTRSICRRRTSAGRATTPGWPWPSSSSASRSPVVGDGTRTGDGSWCATVFLRRDGRSGGTTAGSSGPRGWRGHPPPATWAAAAGYSGTTTPTSRASSSRRSSDAPRCTTWPDPRASSWPGLSRPSNPPRSGTPSGPWSPCASRWPSSDPRGAEPTSSRSTGWSPRMSFWGRRERTPSRPASFWTGARPGPARPKPGRSRRPTTPSWTSGSGGSDPASIGTPSRRRPRTGAPHRWPGAS